MEIPWLSCISAKTLLQNRCGYICGVLVKPTINTISLHSAKRLPFCYEHRRDKTVHRTSCGTCDHYSVSNKEAGIMKILGIITSKAWTFASGKYHPVKSESWSKRSPPLFFRDSSGRRYYCFTRTEAAVFRAAAAAIANAPQRISCLQVLHLQSSSKPFTDTENKALPSFKLQNRGIMYLRPPPSVLMLKRRGQVMV